MKKNNISKLKGTNPERKVVKGEGGGSLIITWHNHILRFREFPEKSNIFDTSLIFQSKFDLWNLYIWHLRTIPGGWIIYSVCKEVVGIGVYKVGDGLGRRHGERDRIGEWWIRRRTSRDGRRIWEDRYGRMRRGGRRRGGMEGWKDEEERYVRMRRVGRRRGGMERWEEKVKIMNIIFRKGHISYNR